MDEDVLACSIKDGKLECKGDATIPTMPVKISWLLIIVAIVLIVIAAVLNHIIFSTPHDYYVLPFFGGIVIGRGTLYDISLFMFVGAPVLIIIVFIFTIKRQTKIVMIGDR